MSIAQLADIEFASPRSLDEACRVMSRHVRDGYKVWAVAGCTDWMVERHIEPIGPKINGVAVDVRQIPELRGISIAGDSVTIGAAEPFLAIRRHPELAARCPLLTQMASEVGATQIQARGTLGGNLVTGSPAADGVTALYALEASVILRSDTAERAVPVTTFYTGYRQSVRKPDELVVRFEFGLPPPGSKMLWRKVGTRKAQSISKVAFAAVAHVGHDGRWDRVGLGMGSVAEVILALDKARALVLGARPAELDMASVERAVDDDIRPIDDIRSTARYRRHVARTLVSRFFEAFGTAQ